MVFPTAAVLVLAWFLLTPVMRFILWVAAPRLGWFARLLLAHGGTLVVMLVATALALDAAELAGMALIYAIGQGVFFLLDLFRPRGHPAA